MISMTQLYKHYREDQLCVIGKDNTSINLISSESLRQIVKSNMSLMHMWLIVVGLKGLIKKNLGTKVLVTIYDNRWSNTIRSIIGTTKVDMSTNGGLFYCSPEYMINSLEFRKYIKIGIQTKWVEEMNNGNNLLLCVEFIGKLSTNSSTKFRLRIDDVVSLMENKGIKLMKPIEINSKDYVGVEWNLEKFTKK